MLYSEVGAWCAGSLGASASILFFRPREFVLGGADAGLYVNLGASITRSGGIVIRDPLLASFGTALEPALLRELPAEEYTPYYYLSGFYVPDNTTGPHHSAILRAAPGLAGNWLYAGPGSGRIVPYRAVGAAGLFCCLFASAASVGLAGCP